MSEPVAIYALTATGAESARRLAPALGEGARLFLPERLAQTEAGETAFARLAPILAANWAAFGGHVLFAAAGIVVRALAGLIQDKASDPAVVVCDPAGRHAVSLLAGHLGGANALARRVAAALGGQAVITTATDQAGLPSLELVASEAGLRVENLKALAGVSAALLDGRPVALDDPEDWLASRLERDWPGLFPAAGPQANPSVGVDWRARPPRPGELLLRPPALWLGLGCNRGTAVAEMDELLTRVLAEAGLSPLALAGLASAIAKADEAGLLALALARNLKTSFYDAQTLDAVAVPNPSDQPRRHLGTRSVAEAAALIAAGPGGRLLVEKQKSGNVTLAVAWGRGR
ncbi:MAG: cobalamin biosynthesis protein [Desulfarculus sp.]|nr:cobalamin biosynthesis protein [Desulfarculus sp.]